MSKIKYHGLPTEKLHDLIDTLTVERDKLGEEVRELEFYFSSVAIINQNKQLQAQLTTTKDALGEICDEALDDIGDAKLLSKAIRKCNKIATKALTKLD